MGQTLTHGVYLPDEGERNCYDGLAANWQILDNSVGTIADHTTALAGKAPAVHTHTKSDITDFPVFGNAAGTICEGNDSRLSDARTPVAHTHTKSDVTDLLNSNFIPSANNTYDLGSSSYQWNNLYAKNYFYNGTAWGLDKANTWTQINYFTKDININSEVAANTQSALSGSKIRQIIFNDSSNSNYFFRLRQYVDATSSRMQFNAQGFDSNNQAYGATFVYRTNSNGNTELYPGDNNQSLGTSTNKWKSLNGINPGALSLPDYNSYLDVTSNIPVASLDGNTLINLDDYLSNKTGWLSIVIDNTAGNSIVVTQGKTGGATAFNNSRSFHTGAQSGGYISVFTPLISDMQKSAFIKASSLIQMRFYYCLGNV